MRTFIQLRDGIGFAYVTTNGEPDHTVTPDHTTAIEVFTDDPSQFIKKVYNSETGSWHDAPVIRFAEINNFGEIIEIKETVFSHELTQNSKVMPENATGMWKYINGSWVEPVTIVPISPTETVQTEVSDLVIEE